MLWSEHPTHHDKMDAHQDDEKDQQECHGQLEKAWGQLQSAKKQEHQPVDENEPAVAVIMFFNRKEPAEKILLAGQPAVAALHHDNQ